jgi:hypothetical protein
MLDSFLGATDSARVLRTFRNLAAHDISRWVLTGGIAIERHILCRGGPPDVRPLHDIDFIAESFDSIPETLGSALLLCHVHPKDLPGKNMFQAIDAETEVRVDVFRAYGLELERAVPVAIAGLDLKMVSLQDLVARHARLNWDSMESKPLAPKYARDFLRLLEYAETDEIESIWREHRKPHFLDSFAATARQLRAVITSRSDLLVPPRYSADVHEVCSRCQVAESFPLADKHQILSILGYC